MRLKWYNTNMVIPKSYQRMVIFLLLLFFVPAILHNTVSAAKIRVKKSVTPSIGGYSSAKLSRATNSILVSFYNLNTITKVSYMLSYAANGIEQGVAGSLTSNGQTSARRDLYFGTCSKGVCTPHYNIKNATLTVTTTLVSGGTTTKRYRIKV